MCLKNSEGGTFLTGCMVCGSELFSTPDKPLLAKCHYCGKEAVTHTFCLQGHYVCDDCHRNSILDSVEKVCSESDDTDPSTLLIKIFDLPGLHMHGPEYHSIVPAVLVTAYLNGLGKKGDSAICDNVINDNVINDNAIKEAIERGKSQPGCMCGTHGACGAGIGVGIAYSLIHKVTPYSKVERGRANHVTAQALGNISVYGGPRCCKRDSMIAVETARENFECFLNCANISYVCKQFLENDLCIGKKCPYFPNKDRGK